ncbi:MAG: hypothetical protein H0V53_14380, partial [Rubrobacter sp.]|nr:hypothetical protein [Rubrobacter sp.]
MFSLANGDDRHAKALRQWRRWSRAKTRLEKDRAIFALWELCEAETWEAASHLADRLSGAFRENEKLTVPHWLAMHGMSEDDTRYAAFPAVAKAAELFHPARGTFQTYAYSFILGELYRKASRGDALNIAAAEDELSGWEPVAKDGPGAHSGQETFDLWRLFELDLAPAPGGSEFGKAIGIQLAGRS